MNVSKSFIITVVSIVVAVLSVYFFMVGDGFAQELSEETSPLDTYLQEKYAWKLGMSSTTESAVKIFCDSTATTSEDGVVLACQNKNPLHKILIGGAQGYDSLTSVIAEIGNSQLYFRNKIDGSEDTGSISCLEWTDAKIYTNALLGANCTTRIADGTKLYSSLVFFKTASTNKVLYIAVVNTSQSSSLMRTELELVSLLKNQERSDFGVFKELTTLFSDTSYLSNITEVSSDKTLPQMKVDQSLSSEYVTLESGDGIDTEVCDASKRTNCYPVYCNSPTAVWAKTISRCIEPINPKQEAVAGDLCTADEPVWDGSRCRPVNGNFISSNTCLVGLGQESCSMSFTWSVLSASKGAEVRYMGETDIVLAQAASGTLEYMFPYKDTPQVLALFDGDKKLGEGIFTTKCKFGVFDVITKKCVNPLPSQVSLEGEYYEVPGHLVFSCQDADSFVVKNGDKDILVATGTYLGKVRVPVTVSGNYTVSCVSGAAVSASSVAYYHAPPPPPPNISMNLSSQSISENGSTTLAWNIRFPLETCSLSAKSVCKSTGCTQAQLESESRLNQIFELEYVDQIPGSSPVQIGDALTKITPGNESTWSASGKKTIFISNSTDFILSCGSSTEVKRRVYTRKSQVTKEQ